ncbi:MAG: hypothetical protein E2O84_02485 [Bacteroidetes bacterium]|nr:MAG: hypothetical protein E2O84_02485 [Bacteroidota bacterium]
MNPSLDQPGLIDYIETFRRRRKVFMTTICVFFGVAVLAAILLPDIYRSGTEMRIDLEGPNIDLLEPLALTSYADQYINSLQRRVMTYDEVTTWIKETNVYSELRDELSLPDLYSIVLDNIRIEMVTTEAMDPRSGRPVSLITGFVAAFEAEEPQQAFMIAEKLAATFLAKDREIRTERAAATSSFLLEEIDINRKKIVKLENRIASFKQDNAGSLPELMGLNMSVTDRTERDMESVRSEIRILQQDKIFRESQLEEIRQRSKSDNRLRQLEDEYLLAISRYGPEHPDVIRIRRQVAALTGGAIDSGESDEIVQLERALAEALQKYSDLHPDVLALQRRLETLRSGNSASVSDLDINPRYLQLRAQINAIDTQIAGLRDRARMLQVKYDEIQDRIALMPQVEKRYLALNRDLRTEQLAFEDLRSRLTQAQQTESYESGDLGARLVKIRNASLPIEPVAPPRLAIVILGGILAVTLAVGAAVLAETLDRSVRGRRDIQMLVNIIPIAEIPIIRGSASILQRRRRAVIIAAVVGGAILLIWSGT